MSYSLMKNIATVIAVTIIALRSISYASFEWRANKSGAAAVLFITALMLGLCVYVMNWQ